MTARPQILFIQGAGAGTYDDWDSKLVESLRQRMGHGCEIRYPRMPDEDDPSFAGWSARIRRELAGLNDGAVAVGHSIGGTVLVCALAERGPLPRLDAIVLIAAPFVGGDGWPGTEFEIPEDLAERLPGDARVLVFHGLGDEVVPHGHADLYTRALPQARVHKLVDRDHQLNGDLTEVADAIRRSEPTDDLPV